MVRVDKDRQEFLNRVQHTDRDKNEKENHEKKNGKYKEYQTCGMCFFVIVYGFVALDVFCHTGGCLSKSALLQTMSLSFHFSLRLSVCMCSCVYCRLLLFPVGYICFLLGFCCSLCVCSLVHIKFKCILLTRSLCLTYTDKYTLH